MQEHHVPVMLKEALEMLNPNEGKSYLDVTFGAGGHTRAILEGAHCKVYAIDRDEYVLPYFNSLKIEFEDRLSLKIGKFSEINTMYNEKFDGLLLDAGMSSMQISDTNRGFSFESDTHLNMEMGINDLTAYDVVNGFPEKEIADILYQFGDETRSRQIAKAICIERRKEKIRTSKHLAGLIHSKFPRGKAKIHPATKTFQAIRIFVNDELNELKELLNNAASMLAPRGRIITIAFHSLEDGIIKRFLRESNDFQVITKKPLSPTQEEIMRNPRSRSAKLRAAYKI